MQGQALSMIMDMMQSCQLKNDALVKHCLDFIAVVGGEDGLPPPAIETLENFKKAMILVYDLFVEAEDVRIKAAAVRTLSALARNPHISFMESDDSIVSSDTLLRTMRTAQMCQVASERDTFCIQVRLPSLPWLICDRCDAVWICCVQVFGIILLFRVNSPGAIPKSSQISEYIRHVHEAVGDIIRYIVDGGEEFFFDNSDSRAKAIEVRCCRCACHCCFIHESCTVAPSYLPLYVLISACQIHDVLAAFAAASKLLSLCGRDSVNFTDAKGLTLLHKYTQQQCHRISVLMMSVLDRLAQSGLKECLRVFMEICGDDIDYLQRTPHGATALNLARASSDATCTALLEKATECAEQSQETTSKENTNVQDKNARSAAAAAALKKQRKKKMGSPVGLEAPELGHKDERSDPFRSQMEDVERVKAEAEYERTLAERRRQLEDMEAAFSRKSLCDKAHYCSEKKAKTSINDMHRSTAVLPACEAGPQKKAPIRIQGKDMEVMGLSAQSDIMQRQQQILGSSISVGSGTNNGSPDPAAAPAGPYDDHSIGTRLSAFQTRPPPLGSRGLPAGDDRMAGTWHSLFAADPADAVQGGPDNKWNMLSSSSGQNNHMTVDAERQSSFIQQQIWPPLNNPPRQQPQPDYGGAQQPSQDALTSNVSGNLSQPPPVSSGLPDDDVADDTQILSWLSSEITGLIGNGPQSDRAPTEIQKSRDFQNGGVPHPPLHNSPSPYENVGESAGFLPMGTSVSPFYGGNHMTMSPYMQHPTPGNFVHSNSGPWGNAVPNAMTVDPRLIPQSEISGGDGRPSVHPSRFWHTEENDIPSKHLWLGNLNTRLPRSVLKSVFEEYGPIEDVVTFPGRMYAFVNFIQPEDAQRAAKELDNMTLPVLTGNRKLVIKFRPNRKALGRVGDLMPGVANIEECNSGAIAPSISVPVLRSPDMSSSQQSGGDSLPQNQAFMEGEHPQERHLLGEREDAFDTADPNVMIGSSCRHLWLGNVCVRPSKTVLFSLFSRYGPVESVRVFPGKTYAFVNFYSGEHAFRAKEALDGKTLTAVTGTKPLVVRFQREGAGPAGWARVQDNFNNIPPLQSAESAPGIRHRHREASSNGTLLSVLGAYVTNNMMLSQDRVNIEVPGGYRSSSNETQRPQSLSPEEYPSLNRSVRGTENAYYDPYQTERHVTQRQRVRC